MTTTQTRFSGPITTKAVAVDDTTPAVLVNIVGVDVNLLPSEAVRLAVHLIEAAAKAEREEAPEWP